MLRVTLWSLAALLVVEAMLLLLFPDRLRAILSEVTPGQLRLVGLIELALAGAVLYVVVTG